MDLRQNQNQQAGTKLFNKYTHTKNICRNSNLHQNCHNKKKQLEQFFRQLRFNQHILKYLTISEVQNNDLFKYLNILHSQQITQEQILYQLTLTVFIHRIVQTLNDLSKRMLTIKPITKSGNAVILIIKHHLRNYKT